MHRPHLARPDARFSRYCCITRVRPKQFAAATSSLCVVACPGQSEKRTDEDDRADGPNDPALVTRDDDPYDVPGQSQNGEDDDTAHSYSLFEWPHNCCATHLPTRIGTFIEKLYSRNEKGPKNAKVGSKIGSANSLECGPQSGESRFLWGRFRHKAWTRRKFVQRIARQSCPLDAG